MNFEFFFDTAIILENEQVKLSPLMLEHFEVLLPIALEKSLWEFTTAKINSAADFKAYFDTALLERQQKKSYPFVIFDKINNQYAGSTRFGNIDFRHKRTEIGWTWLRTSLHSSGFNRQCKFLLLSYAFEKLLLNRVELKTNLLNQRSQKAIRKLGAVEEGVFRKHIINDDGTVRDSMFFSFINDEWPLIKEKFFNGL
jgi:RimJ/RimL family protein N-acetyltransferase